MDPEKRTGMQRRGNWQQAFQAKGAAWASLQRGACMQMKPSTMVFQAHKAQGEVWDGGLWRDSLGIMCLYLFCLTAMGSH